MAYLVNANSLFSSIYQGKGSVSQKHSAHQKEKLLEFLPWDL